MRARYLFLLIIFLLLGWPRSAYAQGGVLGNEPEETVAWQELKTENFIIVYAEQVTIYEEPIECACGVAEADRYVEFIDEIYQDISTLFEIDLEVPIDLHLFPTETSYYEVNPLAEALPGVVAHALNSGEEIAIALPRTRQLTDEELINNIRHELTHLFASTLSEGKLSAGFQEGIAQYLEKPTDQASFDPALLEEALEEGRLLSWADLDEARKVYSDPQVAYPETLSVVSFLIDHYGFPKFIEFMEAIAVEPGYRTALEKVYGKSADQLEAEWQSYLPEYFAGRWQINAIYTYDLTRVTQLVEEGAYSDAQTELKEIVTLLETTEQLETLTEAQILLAKARQGQVAAALADEARQALQNSDYPTTLERGQTAITAYQELGYLERLPEIENYIYRAELGQQALKQLQLGERLLVSWHYLEAEDEIYEATVLLQSLDNQAAAEQGIVLLQRSAEQKTTLIYGCLIIGLALLVMNGLRRVFNHLSAHPLDLEYT